MTKPFKHINNTLPLQVLTFFAVLHNIEGYKNIIIYQIDIKNT